MSSLKPKPQEIINACPLNLKKYFIQKLTKSNHLKWSKHNSQQKQELRFGREVRSFIFEIIGHTLSQKIFKKNSILINLKNLLLNLLKLLLTSFPMSCARWSEFHDFKNHILVNVGNISLYFKISFEQFFIFFGKMFQTICEKFCFRKKSLKSIRIEQS